MSFKQETLRSGVILLCVLLPTAARADQGDEFSNNLFSDLAPLLALFGEQVTKQFLSESMDWIEHIILACGPLGIITAVVSAIRVGGSKRLKAVIGRAKEPQAQAEIELMSSTSSDVCELWNGIGIVRVAGFPNITEVVYNTRVDKLDLDDKGLVQGVSTRKEKMERVRKCQPSLPNWSPHQHGISIEEQELYDETEALASPNISLNTTTSTVSRWLLQLVAVIGVTLQIGVLVFDGIVTYQLEWTKGGKRIPKYAFPLTAIGTLAIVLGMYGCGHVIELSTIEETWVYRAWDPEEPWQVVWLQKGQVVSDQKFKSYAIYAPKDRKVIITSRPSSRQEGLNMWTTVATSLSIIGFIFQFVGLRAMHFSASIAQLIITAIMTLLRVLIRLPPSRDSPSRVASDGYSVLLLPEKNELDYLACHIAGSSSWSVNTCGLARFFVGSLEDSNIPAVVMQTRVQLAEISGAEWTSELRTAALAVAGAIESSMNHFWKIGNDLKSEAREIASFSWEIEVTTPVINEDEGRVINKKGTIELTVERSKYDGQWQPWTVDRKRVEAVLSLYMYDLSTINHFIKSSDEVNYLWVISPEYSKDLEFEGAIGGILADWWITREISLIEFRDFKEACSKFNMSPELKFSSCTPIRKEAVDDTFVVHDGPRQDFHSHSHHGMVYKSSLEHICCQYILHTFMSTVVNSIDQLTGFAEFESRTEYQGLVPGRLVHKFIGSIANILQSSGTLSLDAAYMLTVTALYHADKLPCLDVCEVYKVIAKVFESNSNAKGNLKLCQGLCYIVSKTIPTMIDKKLWQETGKLINKLISVYASVLGPGHGFTIKESERKKVIGRQLVKNKCDDGKEPLSTNSEDLREYSLFEAIHRDRTDLILHILESNDKKPLLVEDGENSVLLAITQGRLDLFQLLMYYQVDFSVNSALEHALKCADESRIDEYAEILRSLVVVGAKVVDDKYDDMFRTQIAEERDPNELIARVGGSLSYNTTINDVDDDADGTALHRAAKAGFGLTVRLLLEKGAHVNITNHDKETALHTAAKNGYEAIVRNLLDSGADVNAKEGKRNTPLLFATRYGHEEVVKVLLNYGADVNQTDEDNISPIECAMFLTAEIDTYPLRRALLQLLLDKGANPNLMNNRAFKEGSGILLKVLIENDVIVENLDDLDSSALHLAVESNNESVVLILLEYAKMDPNITSRFLGTPLHVAAAKGFTYLVNILLEFGADLGRKTKQNGETPLHKAAMSGNEGALKALIKNGAIIDETDTKNRFTALHFAANFGHEIICKILLEHGADVNKMSKGGSTPLFRAADNGFKKAATVLLSSGADPTIRNKGGFAPVDAAIQHRNTSLITIIKRFSKLSEKNSLNLDIVKNDDSEVSDADHGGNPSTSKKQTPRGEQQSKRSTKKISPKSRAGDNDDELDYKSSTPSISRGKSLQHKSKDLSQNSRKLKFNIKKQPVATISKTAAAAPAVASNIQAAVGAELLLEHRSKSDSEDSEDSDSDDEELGNPVDSDDEEDSGEEEDSEDLDAS